MAASQDTGELARLTALGAAEIYGEDPEAAIGLMETVCARIDQDIDDLQDAAQKSPVMYESLQQGHRQDDLGLLAIVLLQLTPD